MVRNGFRPSTASAQWSSHGERPVVEDRPPCCEGFLFEGVANVLTKVAKRPPCYDQPPHEAFRDEGRPGCLPGGAQWPGHTLLRLLLGRKGLELQEVAMWVARPFLELVPLFWLVSTRNQDPCQFGGTDYPGWTCFAFCVVPSPF